MATCGYLCPSCEGRGFREDGTECDWCSEKKTIKKVELEEWIKIVHEGPCCSDSEDKDCENKG